MLNWEKLFLSSYNGNEKRHWNRKG